MNLFNKIIKVPLFISFVLLSFIGNSQTSDQKMASYYFEKADFEKAKMYYEKVFKTNQSSYIFNNYLATLFELKEYKEAEKITKKLVKKNPNRPFFKIKLGEIYEYQGKEEKAKKYYNELIEELDSKTATYKFSLLSNEFLSVNKLDLALATLIKGEKQDKSATNRFALSIANIYGQQGKTEEMIDTYLSYLDKYKTQTSRVKTYLSNSIDFETQPKKAEILRKKLLQKTQKNPENESYSDLLIWLFQLTDNYNSAYIQIKAKDRRTNANGEIVYRFARQCNSQKKYNLAVEAFEYLISKKNTTDFIRKSSKYLILKTLKEKITTNHHYTKPDLLNLNKRYTSTLSEIEDAYDKIPLLQDMAILQGFYLHNIDTAEIILKTILNSSAITKKEKATNKTLLGDILMLKNEVWEASLLYMQVEKEFKHDIAGSTAKFKNAKLYYYTGDFEWSQNQLDALKASTSKLISNDAIDLSLLITDNYNMDTTPVNMQRFAQADLLIFQNKFDEAILKLDTINRDAPDHSLSDEILFRRYQIAYKKQEFKSAKDYLTKIIENYAEDILADNAIYKLAELEENQLNNKENAKKLYEKLLFDYPGSLFVVEARKRYRKLNDGKTEIRTIEKVVD